MWNGDARLEHGVHRLERLGEQAPPRDTRRRSSRACARSRAPGAPSPCAREISTTSSSEPRSRTRPITSTPNGTARSFASSRSRSVPSCSTTAAIAVLAGAAEQEAGVEDDELGAARRRRCRRCGRARRRPTRTSGRSLEVAHEAEERRVHRERDVGLARRLAEPLGPRVVHPEAALEVDLARVVAALEQDLDGRARGSRARARRAGRRGVQSTHSRRL